MQSVSTIIDPFDRSPGNGSNDTKQDWLDGESIFSNEWGSQAATTFNPDGSDANGHSISQQKREHMKRLYKRQNGKGNPDRPGQIRDSYVKNDTEMFLSVLEMPSNQRDTVRQILQNLDISSNNFGGKPYEKIILTICSLVADEALSNRRNPSIDERLFLTDRFRDLMESCSMSSTDHRKLRVSVREKSDYFG